jgi:hypothetical protein
MADEKRLYVFYGRILPERAHVYFNLKQKKAEIAGVNVEFDVFCFGSQFNGTAKFDKDVTQLEVQTIVQALMRSFLDRLCFENICAYDFDLTGAVSVASGDKWIYGVNEPVFHDKIEDQSTFAKKQIPFISEVVNLTFHEIRLDHALRCFSHAIRDRALTTLFCYLAIETVARGVVELQRQKEVDEIQSAEWEAFRKGLRIQEATIKGDVKALSDKFRHGNFIDTSWDERKRALSLTWEIIRRYMFYLRGKGDLPESDFPLV